MRCPGHFSDTPEKVAETQYKYEMQILKKAILVQDLIIRGFSNMKKRTKCPGKHVKYVQYEN